VHHDPSRGAWLVGLVPLLVLRKRRRAAPQGET
jgi:hypothetical protein